NTGNAFVRYNGSGLAPTIGTAAAFWTDPVQPGVLLAWNPVTTSGTLNGFYLSSNAATASQLAWTCIDPTPNNPMNFSGAVAFLPGGGRYLLGTTAGTIYRITAPVTAGSTPCSSSTPTANVAALWTAPLLGSNPTAVIGIAPDSAAPMSSFFAT